MVDIATGLVVLGGVVASKETLDKVLGSTAEYIGGELKNLVEKCNLNLSSVFNSSLKKGAAERNGSVNPRSANAIINDAAYCNDELAKDYYGGLLCGSKVEDDDDSAIPYISVLKQMSQLQIRAHFLIYAVMYRHVTELKSITLEEERGKVLLVIDIGCLFSFVEKELGEWEPLINHIVSGLIRNKLIEDYFQYGGVDYLTKKLPKTPIETPSLVVKPTILGVELFLWAAGIPSPNPNIFLDKTHDLLNNFPEKFVNMLPSDISLSSSTAVAQPLTE